jgi:hypothetical protein
MLYSAQRTWSYSSIHLGFTLCAVGLCTFSIIFCFGIGNVYAQTVPGAQQKGASFYGKAPDDYSRDTFKRSVDQFVATGGTDIALLYHVYQPNQFSSTVNAGWNTPTDQALRDGITYAKSKGLRVMVTLKLDNEVPNVWHAEIDPSNRDTWFQSYQEWLLRIGRVGASVGLDQMSIGTELYKTASEIYNPDNTKRWKRMIGALRTVFPGKLTFGTQHTGDRSELLELGFGTDLDYIGISAYFPLTAFGANVDESIRLSWQKHEARVLEAQRKYGKPIIFTEAGYRSIRNSHIDSYAFWRDDVIDLEEQVRSYEGLFSYWTSKSYYAGTYIWAWETNPNAGGSSDKTYTPQNKPAQLTLCKWYRYNGTQNCSSLTNATGTPTTPTTSPATSTGGGTTQPPTTVTSGTFTITGSMPPTSEVNTPVSTSVDVRPSAAFTNGIVQVEVFDARTWKQVDRYVFRGVSINADESRSLQFTWTPIVTGVYNLKVGVYTAGWSQLAFASLDAAQTNVSVTAAGGTTGGGTFVGTTGGSNGSTTGGTPTTSPISPTTTIGTVSIWWPGSDATISGTQPVRAVLEGVTPTTYTMTFHIDGGSSVSMTDGNTPSPHKIGNLDAGLLTAGLHTLSITARNSSGAVIGTRTIEIAVTR